VDGVAGQAQDAGGVGLVSSGAHRHDDFALAVGEAAQRNPTGHGFGNGRIDLVFEPGHQLRYGLVVRAVGAGGGHQTATQFADRGFPGLGVCRDPLGRHLIEGPFAGSVQRVVAVKAIGFDDSPGLAIVSGLIQQDERAACPCDEAEAR
jgi:hypothetical protein